MLTYKIQRIENGNRRRRTVKPSRLYVCLPETILENLENRRNRDVAVMRSHARIGIQMLNELPAGEAQLDVRGTKLRWSQKAGCNCGCSPGFILETHLWAQDIGYFDLHVTVVDTELEARKERERAAQVESEAQLLAKYG